MTTSAQKGNYYKAKTKKHFEGLGYHVEYLEFYISAGKFNVKKDILGADGLCINDREFFIWQSCLGKSNVAAEIRKLRSYPHGGIKRFLVVWEAGNGTPDIREVYKKEEKCKE